MLGVCTTGNSEELLQSLDDPITTLLRVKDFHSNRRDGLYLGVIDTGANACIMRRDFASSQGFPVYRLRNTVPIGTANNDTYSNFCTILHIEVRTNDNSDPYWLKTLWYILDTVAVDMLIGRYTMRLLGIDCVKLNRGQFRHHAVVTTALRDEDNIYWDALPNVDEISKKRRNEPSKSQTFGDDAEQLINNTFEKTLPLSSNRPSITVHWAQLNTDECVGYTSDDTVDTFHAFPNVKAHRLDPALRIPGENIEHTVPPPSSLLQRSFPVDYKGCDFIDVSENTEIENVTRFLEQEELVTQPQDVDKPRSDVATRRYLYSVEVDKSYANEPVIVGPDLSSAEKVNLHKLIARYESQIAQNWSDCGLIDGVYLKLDLKPGSRPFKRHPYRQSFEMMNEIESQCRKLWEADFIEPSNSEFASPVTMVPKKLVNGTLEWRMCIDYRMLNSMTIKDHYPLPNITTIHRHFHGNKFFTALDLRHGYHHIEIRPEDRHKTAFITHKGLYEWKRMSFGFVNAPATFQRAMNHIFRNHSFVIVYLDDILILSKTKEEHLRHISIVLDLLEEYDLKIRIGKCKFFTKELKYLGFVLTGDGLRADPDHVQKIREINEPVLGETVRKGTLQRMIGMIQWLHRYIPRLADWLDPITELSSAKGKAIWTSACSASLNRIKQLVSATPLLRHPNLANPFYVVCDASDVGIGAVLMQQHEALLHPCEFWSKKFDLHQKHWHVSEKELVAIVLTLEKWQRYLLGHHFHVFTDHKNLIELHDRQGMETLLNAKLKRWWVRIEMFDFTAHYIKGIHNVAADYLSRDALMETATRHHNESDPERVLNAKPLMRPLKKHESLFVDVDRSGVADGDQLIRIVDGGMVKNCFIVESADHHVTHRGLRRSPRIAAKMRELQALREPVGVFGGNQQIANVETGLSHPNNTSSSLSRSPVVAGRITSALRQEGPLKHHGDEDEHDASRVGFARKGDTEMAESSRSTHESVETASLVDVDGDVDVSGPEVTRPREPLVEVAEDGKDSITENETPDDDEIESEWRRETERLRSSELETDQELAQLLEKDYSQVISADKLRAALLNDAIGCSLIKILEEGASVLTLSLPRSYQVDIASGCYRMRHGLVWYSGRKNKTWRSGYLIPPKLRYAVINYFHGSLHTLHQGSDRMQRLMEGRVYWRGMSAEIRRHCEKCPCRLAKSTPSQKQGFMELFPAQRPFEVVHLDVVGPLPHCHSGNRYILTMMDRFSRMVKMVCLSTITANAIAMAFRNHWLLEYGSPGHILTDRGSDFTGTIMKILGQMFGFRHRVTTSYHPESNGALERFHRYLKERLRCIAHERGLDFLGDSDWDSFVPGIAFSYNCTPNRMFGYSPYEVVFGEVVRLPIDNILSQESVHDMAVKAIAKRDATGNVSNEQRKSPALRAAVKAYVHKMTGLREDIQTQIRLRTKGYDESRKVAYDRKRIPSTRYQTGERVYVDTRSGKVGNAKKLPINRKSARITDKIGENVYVVRYDDGSIDKVNVRRILKPRQESGSTENTTVPTGPADKDEPVRGRHRNHNAWKRRKKRKKSRQQDGSNPQDPQ